MNSGNPSRTRSFRGPSRCAGRAGRDARTDQSRVISSGPAVALVRENAALNGVSDTVNCDEADAEDARGGDAPEVLADGQIAADNFLMFINVRSHSIYKRWKNKRRQNHQRYPDDTSDHGKNQRPAPCLAAAPRRSRRKPCLAG